MNAPQSVRHYRFEALLIESDPRSESLPDGARMVRLHTAAGSWDALCWIDPRPFYEPGDVVGVVDAIEVDKVGLVVTRFQPRPRALALDLICDSVCPVRDVVTKVRALIDTVSEPLRGFLRAALSLPEAAVGFWLAPASLNHHHAYMGGLAEHSLDVATRAAAAMDGELEQRDLAVAYALLHDFGKVWAYRSGRLTQHGRLLGHEQIGFEKLLPLLLELRAAWPDGGLVMQSLLSGEWKRARTAPVIAAGSVVRSLDQASAERGVVDHPDPSRRRWQPRLVK